MEFSIRTVVIGCSFGGGDSTTQLELPAEGLSLRQLIERKVRQDVADFNRNRHLLYGREFRAPEELLVDEEAAADTARHGTYEPVDWEVAAARAIEAFAEGAFSVTVDERRVRALDEPVELARDSDVVFTRLMPFISG